MHIFYTLTLCPRFWEAASYLMCRFFSLLSFFIVVNSTVCLLTISNRISPSSGNFFQFCWGCFEFNMHYPIVWKYLSRINLCRKKFILKTAQNLASLWVVRRQRGKKDLENIYADKTINFWNFKTKSNEIKFGSIKQWVEIEPLFHWLTFHKSLWSLNVCLPYLFSSFYLLCFVKKRKIEKSGYNKHHKSIILVLFFLSLSLSLCWCLSRQLRISNVSTHKWI